MELLERMEALRIMEESDDGTRRSVKGHRGRHKAVFIDRDGVLNEDTVHLHDRQELIVISGSKEALKGFRALDITIVIITNQAGIGKGLFTKEDFVSVMEALNNELGPPLPWDGVYFCPFFEEAVIERYRTDHIDRKPHPGMLLRAALEMDLDLPSSFMIGDHIKDVQAAHRAGCRAVLVMSGRGKEELRDIIEQGIGPGDERYPDFIAQDIGYALEAIRGKFS